MEKLRYDLVPPRGIEEVHKVFNQKLENYSVHEWKKGMSWTQVLANLKRHLHQFELGNDYTDEGLLQMSEVAMNALILCDYYHSYPQGDDRILGMVDKPIVSLDIDDVCLDFQTHFQNQKTK